MSYPTVYLVKDVEGNTLFRSLDMSLAIKTGKQMDAGGTQPLSLAAMRFINWLDHIEEEE